MIATQIRFITIFSFILTYSEIYINHKFIQRILFYFSLDMTVPTLSVTGKYEMTGKAFVVIKDSFGPFNVS